MGTGGRTETGAARHSAKDVATFFLTMAEPDVGDGISNLKLQKLCYYAQGFALVTLRRPLFRESIEAWEHGPVVKDLYHAFKEHGAQPLPVPTDFKPELFDREERELLEDVWDVYGQFSAWKLRNLTHEEPPWVNTERGDVISHELMEDFFRTLVVKKVVES